MAISYRPPGVLPVNEVQSAPLLPAASVSQQIPCFIGEARGYETYTDVFTAGTAAKTLTKKGIVISDSDQKQLSFTVSNPATYEVLNPGNYIITQTAGTAVGDETTTFQPVSLPGTFAVAAGTAVGTAIGAGQYRYAVSWVVNIDSGGGTATYETGIGSVQSVTLNSSVAQVDLTALPAGTAAAGSGITVVGRNIYRSKNLGTTNNPNWGPYYRLTGAGTVTINDASTNTYSDTVTDASAYPNQLPGISPTDTVTVQYNFADTTYYEPTLFVDYNDIIDRYGEPFTDTGLIDSELAFGAKIAMLNGADSVVCVAVPSNATVQQWQDAVLRLEEDEDSTVVVPLTGNTSIHASVAAHCLTMKGRNVFRTAVFGLDGVAGTVSPTDLRNFASSYNRDDIQVASPAIFRYFNTYLNTEIEIGGQYMAAALAGMRASRQPSDSLTRQVIAGFSGVGEKRSSVAMNQDAQAGLAVIEQRGGVIRLRHDITSAPGVVSTRETPVIMQKYNMIRGILGVYENSVVGKLKANSESLAYVLGLTSSYLNNLVRSGQLDSFNGLGVNYSASDPTTVEVRWQYKPIYTIHYVSITIGINISTGSTSVNTRVNNPLL